MKILSTFRNQSFNFDDRKALSRFHSEKCLVFSHNYCLISKKFLIRFRGRESLICCSSLSLSLINRKIFINLANILIETRVLIHNVVIFSSTRNIFHGRDDAVEFRCFLWKVVFLKFKHFIELKDKYTI